MSDSVGYLGEKIGLQRQIRNICDPVNLMYCNEEKVGCSGCFYEPTVTKPEVKKVLLNDNTAFVDELRKSWFRKCIHCDTEITTNDGVYCEDCYQKLIAENAALQLKIDNMVGPDMSKYVSKEETKLFIKELWILMLSYHPDKNTIIMNTLERKIKELEDNNG